MFKHLLKPIFNVEDHLIRFEFQNRGAIHAHMVVTCKGGPTFSQMLMSRKSAMKPDTCTEEELALGKEAQEAMEFFNSHIVGITAVHPEFDPIKCSLKVHQLKFTLKKMNIKLIFTYEEKIKSKLISNKPLDKRQNCVYSIVCKHFS